MYTPFVYNQLGKTFHFLPADACYIGFNFTKKSEAKTFYKAVMQTKENVEKLAKKFTLASNTKSNADASIVSRKDKQSESISKNVSLRLLTNSFFFSFFCLNNLSCLLSLAQQMKLIKSLVQVRLSIA